VYKHVQLHAVNVQRVLSKLATVKKSTYMFIHYNPSRLQITAHLNSFIAT